MKKQFGINYDDLQVSNHDSEEQLYIFLGWSYWLTLSIGGVLFAAWIATVLCEI